MTKPSTTKVIAILGFLMTQAGSVLAVDIPDFDKSKISSAASVSEYQAKEAAQAHRMDVKQEINEGSGGGGPDALIHITTSTTPVAYDEYAEYADITFKITIDEDTNQATVEGTGVYGEKLNGKYDPVRKLVIAYFYLDNEPNTKLTIKLRDDLSIDYVRTDHVNYPGPYLKLSYSKQGLLTQMYYKGVRNSGESFYIKEDYKYVKIDGKYRIKNFEKVESNDFRITTDKITFERDSKGNKLAEIKLHKYEDLYSHESYYSAKYTDYRVAAYETITSMEVDAAIFETFSGAEVKAHVLEKAKVQTIAYYHYDEYGRYHRYFVSNERNAKGKWVPRFWEDHYNVTETIVVGEPDFLKSSSDSKDIYIKDKSSWQDFNVNGKEIEGDMVYQRNDAGKFMLIMYFDIYDNSTGKSTFVKWELNYPNEKKIKIEGVEFEVVVVNGYLMLQK